MAGLFDNQAEFYLDARPRYSGEWFNKLAELNAGHSVAWDVGTGNGQAAIGLVEHYEKVIATDVSEPQIRNGLQHPRIHYFHTPLSMSDEELVSLAGGENSVDLITVATAIHYFDIPRFYSIAKRVLKKPGGIIAVWGYTLISTNPEFDQKWKSFSDSISEYFHPKAKLAFDGYTTLPFPFASVGLGSEGKPIPVDIPKEMSFEGFVNWLKSMSAVSTAKEKGVDVLPEKVIKEFEVAWGGPNLVKSVVYKGFMLAGKVKL